MRSRLSHVVWSLISIIFVGSLSGCQKDYDFERQDTPTRTLGHELFVIWKKDAERAAVNAEAKTQMLDENYIEFVDAVDTIAPEDQLEEVDTFLQNVLKVVDEGILPAITRRLRALLIEAVDDIALMSALATPTGPDAESFVSLQSAPNIAGFVTAYPRLPEFLSMIARIGLENDGVNEDGLFDPEEPDSVTNITRSFVQMLEDAEVSDDEPLAVTLRDLAMVPDPRYTADEDISPIWVVLYDDRGYPLPVMIDGSPGFPFVDDDSDGLADLNAQGEFIYKNGGSGTLDPFTREESIDDPVVRDESGRALLPGGDPVYQYVDLHNTGLGFLVREFQPLSAEDTLYDMLVAFQAIMGPKTVQTDEDGAYQGYSDDHPLADLSYAMVHMMDIPEMPSFMRGLSELMERKPEALAKLFYALDRVIDVLNQYPDAAMTDDQTLVYDLMPHLRELVNNPELFADVLWAFRQPISKKTGESMGTLLRFKDNDAVPAPGGPYDSCFSQCRESHQIGTLPRYSCIRACPNEELFSEPMDFDAPESERGRSLLQKFLHLVRDAGGVEYRMTIREASIDGRPLPELPPLMALPGAGEAYLRSIAGMLDLADFVPDEVWTSDLGDLLSLLGVDAGNVASLLSTLSPLFGAELDRVPRPDQITRLFNQEDLRFETDRIVLDVDDPVCKDQYVMSKHLAYGLFVGEASGTIDTIYPLAVAFSTHDAESTLAGIFSVIHDHYAGDASLYKTRSGGPSQMKASDIRSYEEALEVILTDDELFVALNEFAIAIDEVEAETDIPMTEDLRKFLQHGLEKDFRTRNGDDYVIIDDGSTLTNPSRLEVMLHAIGEASKRLEAVPETRQRLRDAVGNVADVAIGAEKDTSGEPRFKRPGSPVLAAHLTRYFSVRAQEEIDSGDFSQWLQVELVDFLDDIWTSRMMAGLVDLASNTLENDADRQLIDDFVSYLFGSQEGRAQIAIATHQMMVSSINSEVWIPVAKFLARALDPDRDWGVEPRGRTPMLTLGAEMLAKTLEYDPQNTGIFLINRGLQRKSGQDTPFTVLLDVIAAYFSPDPLADQLQSPEDYRIFFDELARYLEDDVHGVERLYELVGRRKR